MVNLSEVDRERIKKLFKEIDQNQDGVISIQELSHFIKNKSAISKPERAEEIITDKGSNDSTLSLQEFVSYIKDTETQLKLAFKQLDRNNDQLIDVDEIRTAMEELGVKISEKDAEKLLKQMDKNGSVKIDYDEWREFLLFSGTTDIKDIFRYWRRASAIDLGDNMSVPDDYTQEEKKSGLAWKTLFSGGVAGCVSRTVTAPLDRIKLTWQALGGKAVQTGLLGTVKKMINEGGVRSLWRGNGVNCLKIAPESAFKFQAYEMYKSKICDSDTPPSMYCKFFAGALAGATAQTIIYPMEVLKTRMCLRKTGQYTSIIDCARKLYKANGIGLFYRGYIPNMMGILPYAGIELALFETFKQTYANIVAPNVDTTPPVYVSVTAGALSSVCGQLTTYPLALIRTKLQAHASVDNKLGVISLAKNILRHEGVAGLYCGLGPNMIKVIPAVGVSAAVFDQTRALLIK